MCLQFLKIQFFPFLVPRQLDSIKHMSLMALDYMNPMSRKDLLSSPFVEQEPVDRVPVLWNLSKNILCFARSSYSLEILNLFSLCSLLLRSSGHPGELVPCLQHRIQNQRVDLLGSLEISYKLGI